MAVENKKKNQMSALPGLAGIGLMVTGFAGIIHAFYQADFACSGIGLVASAIAFGIVFYSSLK